MPRKRTHGQGAESRNDENDALERDVGTDSEDAAGNGARGRRAARGQNGASAEHADSTEGQSSTSPTMRRAEESVDRMAERVGHYASVIGQKLAWLAARAREEAEDIWAEAQAIRRGEHR
jgi:hypothetical protein